MRDSNFIQAKAIEFDEAKMIQYANQGDLNAFNRLVLEYQDLAYNVAYRVMGIQLRRRTALRKLLFLLTGS